MKKLIAGALVLAMTIAFAGCGSASPTDVAESFLQAIKANDTGALQGVYAGTLEETEEGEEEITASANLLSQLDSINDDSDDSEATEEESTTEAETDTEEAVEDEDIFTTVLEDKLTAFDYTLSNEVIDGDKASVDVTVTTYDLGAATRTALGEYLQQAIGLAFAGASEEYMTELLNDTLKDNYEPLTEKEFEETVTLNLVKVDDEWKVADANENEEAIDGLFGGLISAFTDFENAFSGSDETTDDGISDSENDIFYTEDDIEDTTDNTETAATDSADANAAA